MPDLFLFTFSLILYRFEKNKITGGFGFYIFGLTCLVSQIFWIFTKYASQLWGDYSRELVNHVNLNWQVFGLFILIIGLENILIYSPRNNGFIKLILNILNFLTAFAYAGFFYLLYR